MTNQVMIPSYVQRPLQTVRPAVPRAPAPVQPQPVQAQQQPVVGPYAQPLSSQSLNVTSRASTTPTNTAGNVPTQFTPTQLTKPTRQAVNDPGIFGQQSGAINARLAQLLDPSYQDVATTDRDINPLVQSIDRNAQQTARLAQAQAAERAAAEGTLQGGGFSNEAQQIFEQSRQQAGDQTAQLLADKSRERQAQIQQALQLGSGLLDAQQERNLRRELADLQNEQEFNKLSLNKDLGFGDLNLRSALGFGDLDVRNRGLDIQRELGLGNLDLGRSELALKDRLGTGDLDLRKQGLSQDDAHFYDKLGFDKSAFEADQNARIVSALLGF